MDTQTKENKQKPAPDVFTRNDRDFFEELPITINMEEGNSFVLFMRPLKVKEIQILNRVIYLQEKDPDSEQAAYMLVKLAASMTDLPSDQIPIGAGTGLVSKMMELNFPEPSGDEPKEEKAPVKSGKEKDGLIDCFDFLITNGHRYKDILDYPIPVFNNFIVVTAERLGVKKPVTDPAAAFRKLGLPIKSRGTKK